MARFGVSPKLYAVSNIQSKDSLNLASASITNPVDVHPFVKTRLQSLSHSSGNYSEHIAALEPQCCAGVGRWNPHQWGAGAQQCGAGTSMLHRSAPPVGRWNPPVWRWNLNAAQEWGAGAHQSDAGIVMLHMSGIAGYWNPHPLCNLEI